MIKTFNLLFVTMFGLGKIKFNDKILHRSRVIRYYTEKDTPIQDKKVEYEDQLRKKGFSDEDVVFELKNWSYLEAKRIFIENSFDFAYSRFLFQHLVLPAFSVTKHRKVIRNRGL